MTEIPKTRLLSTFRAGLEGKDVLFLQIQKTNRTMCVAFEATAAVVRDSPATHAAASTLYP